MPKIHVTWPPGCYGSYVMQSVYAYSNLGATSKIVIDPTGSSHSFRDSDEQCKYFTNDHALSNDSDIIIGAVSGHELDYLSNHFAKQYSKEKIKIFLHELFPDFELQVSKQWHNNEDWALREWISFWLPDILAAAYQPNTNADITTDQLFNKNNDIFVKEITRLIKKLGLSIDVDINTIKTNHAEWQKKQQHHNMQYRCDNWIGEILNTNKDTVNPCLSIIDEAYVQYRLRMHGYEIRCFGLNNFPTTSIEFKLLLYKETQDDTSKSKNNSLWS